jgi:hypothetical protein
MSDSVGINLALIFNYLLNIMVQIVFYLLLTIYFTLITYFFTNSLKQTNPYFILLISAIRTPPPERPAEGAKLAGLLVFTGRPERFNAQACQ